MTCTRFRSLLGILALSTSALVSSSTAHADFIWVNGEGFEAPAYSTTFLTTGQLEGQFAETTGGLGSDQWGYSPTSSGMGTAVVQSAVPGPGASLQSVRVTRAANSEDFYGVPIEVTPIDQYMIVEWDMMVPTQALNPLAFGPLFGVAAFDDQGVIGGLGGFYVDAATREILYEDGTQLQIADELISYDVWNHFELYFDFDNDLYSLIFNGTLIDTVPFAEAGLDQFSDANIFAGAGFGDPASQAATGVAYFDNFTVYETNLAPVPEPTSMALMGLGVILLACRRHFA